MNYVIIYSVVLLGIIMLLYYTKQKTPFKSAFKGMISGGMLLIAVHFLSTMYDTSIPLNLFNTSISLLLGVPGVAFVIICNSLIV